MNEKCQEMRDKLVDSMSAGLPPGEKAEIERHLADCPACLEYLEALRVDDQRLIGFADVSTASAGRVETGVMKALERAGAQRGVAGARGGRSSAGRRIIQVAAAAAVIALAVWTLGHYGLLRGSTPAFASVIEKIEKARTVCFREAFDVEGAPTFTGQEAINEEGIERSEMLTGPGAGIVMLRDLNRGLFLTLNPKGKWAFLERQSPSPKKPFQYLDWLQNVSKKSGKFVKREMIDGRVTNVFVLQKGEYYEATFWVDAETDLPVKVEEVRLPNANKEIIMPRMILQATDFGSEEQFTKILYVGGSNGQQQRSTVVYDSFKWNVPLDKALFSFTPPEGYTVRQTNTDVSDRGDRELTDALASWADLSGGAFPSDIHELSDSAKVIPMLKAKFNRGGDPDKQFEAAVREANVLLEGLRFAQNMMLGHDWHYAGAGERLGDSEKAICWWKPKDSATYRVVYGDMKIKDLSPSDVGKLR